MLWLLDDDIAIGIIYVAAPLKTNAISTRSYIYAIISAKRWHMRALKTSIHETTDKDSDYLIINLHHGSVLLLGTSVKKSNCDETRLFG